MAMEVRMFEFEITANQNEEHGHFLTGRPIVYGTRGNIGKFDEVIEQGALDKADLKDVRFLVNHNKNMIPLARSRNNNENSTMQLSVDDMGLAIRVDLDTENNSEARSLYSAVKRGDISGMSFGFFVDSDKWENVRSDRPIRHVRSISRLVEVSAVTSPCYGATSIQARGLSDALESAEASLESARAEADAIDRKKQKIRILMEI